MPMHPHPVIFECTLRDASYVVNFQFTAEHTRMVARALEDAGFLIEALREPPHAGDNVRRRRVPNFLFLRAVKR